MFIKKQVVIFGNNQSLLNYLIDNLLAQNYKVNIFLQDPNSYLFKKDTLNRVSYFNINSKNIENIINNADVIINTLFMISPNSIKKIRENIKSYKKIAKSIDKKIKIINIFPLINDDRIKSFYKDIKECEQSCRETFDNYIFLYTSVVLSQQDSLIQDIEELYQISNKVFDYKENFSYIDKDDLIQAIIILIEDNSYNKSEFEIGSFYSTNIDYVNDIVIIDSNELHEISSISLIILNLLSFIWKRSLSSFSREYLYFIKACKKSSRNTLNLETLHIKRHSLMCILNKYKNTSRKLEYEEYEI